MWRIVALIVIAALTRIFSMNMPNFTPMLAIGLIGGLFLPGYRKYLIPIGAWLLSDLMIEALYRLGLWAYGGLHQGMWFIYLTFALIILLSEKAVKKASWTRIVSGSVGASVVFFILTNFYVWLVSGMYPHTPQGLVLAYEAALPFFKNTLLSTILYSSIMYGIILLTARNVQTEYIITKNSN